MKLPLANGRYRKPAKIIGCLFGYSAIAVWFFALWLFFRYDDTRPRQPDPSEGHVYAQSNHGHIVYLTKTEASNITNLRITSFGLAGAAMLTLYAFGDGIEWQQDQKRYRKGKPWEKKQW